MPLLVYPPPPCFISSSSALRRGMDWHGILGATISTEVSLLRWSFGGLSVLFSVMYLTSDAFHCSALMDPPELKESCVLGVWLTFDEIVELWLKISILYVYLKGVKRSSIWILYFVIRFIMFLLLFHYYDVILYQRKQLLPLLNFLKKCINFIYESFSVNSAH